MLRCTSCRAAKQKCLPICRAWPAKCDRCEQKGLPCSEPKRAPRKQEKEAAAIFNTPTDSVESEGDLDQWLRTPEIRNKINEIVEMILCQKNIELALEWLDRQKKELLKLFPEDRFEINKVTPPKGKIQLQEAQGHVRSLIENKIEALNSVAKQLGIHGAPARLQLWWAFQIERVDCELCKIMRGNGLDGFGFVDVAGSFLEEDDILRKKLLACALASRSLCEEHETELVASLKQIFLGEEDTSITEQSQDLGFHRWFPPVDKNPVPYMPDTLVEHTLQWQFWASGFEMSDLSGRTDVLGRTTLHRVLDSYEPNTMYFLERALKIGSDMPSLYNQQDCLGRTPLYIACQKKNTSVVQQLLRKGADASIATHFGLLPAHVAAATGSVGVCQTLRKHKHARIDTSSPAGKKARDYALDNFHFSAANILLDKYNPRKRDPPTNIDVALLQGILRGSTNDVDVALANGADANALFDPAISGGRQTETAMTIALFQSPERRFEIAALLLDYGEADVDAKIERGETALHIFVKRNDISAVKWLLERNADFMARDAKDRTALMLAVKKDLVILVNLLSRFTRHSPKLLHAIDGKGHTAMDYARWYGHNHIAPLLMRNLI
ncbi:hypothetical protein DPSP01_001860 [Paraphaeosphaeria sporulosa]